VLVTFWAEKMLFSIPEKMLILEEKIADFKEKVPTSWKNAHVT